METPQGAADGAQMAELVDALASGASGLTAVEVRVLSWAPHSQTASHPIGCGAVCHFSPPLYRLRQQRLALCPSDSARFVYVVALNDVQSFQA